MPLSKNKIGDFGAAKLARTLRTNTSLRIVNLFDCDIHSAGALALAASLAVNYSVVWMDLGGNAIPKQVLRLVQEQIDKNKDPATRDNKERAHKEKHKKDGVEKWWSNLNNNNNNKSSRNNNEKDITVESTLPIVDVAPTLELLPSSVLT